MKPIASYPTISAGLAECGICIESAAFAPEGKVFTAASGARYYCMATWLQDGISYKSYFMPQALGCYPISTDARVVAGQQLLTRRLAKDYPCQRCGGSGVWVGRFRGTCFACGGDGLHHKFFGAKWALPTTY